jgi:hypothetical protein
MTRLLLVPTILAIGVVSCAKSTSVVEPVAFTLQEAADSIAVPLGATVTIDRVLLRFADVPSDSRCPTNVVCVWEGDAAVRITLTLACTRAQPACAVPELLVDLHTRLDPKATVYAGLEVRLLGLRPYPSGTPTRKGQYVALFRVRPVAG